MLIVSEKEDMGPMFTNNNQNMTGLDGAYSIPLKDNTSLWFFGDTLIGKRTETESLWYPDGKRIGTGNMGGIKGITEMLTNSALILRNLEDYSFLLDEKKGGLKQLIPYREDEDPDVVRIWCFHGIEIEETMYLFYQKVKMSNEDVGLPVHFEIVGSGLSKGFLSDLDFKRLSHKGSDIIWDETKPQFSSTVLKGRDENFIYLYGVRMNEDKKQQVFISRITPENIENFDSYLYYAGENKGWVSDLEQAEPLFEGMPNELSVSWNPYLNAYLSVHSLEIWGIIVARTSPTPWGPWSYYTVLHELDLTREKELPYPVLTYAAKEHPELAEDNGKTIFITYIEFEEYFPHLLKITLEKEAPDE